MGDSVSAERDDEGTVRADSQRAALLRSLPKVDVVLASRPLQAARLTYRHSLLVARVRSILEAHRRRIAAGEDVDPASWGVEVVAGRALEQLAESVRSDYRRVVNATGIVLHTNLGRAPLAEAAVRAVAETAGHPQRVEVDLESGRRGGRDRGCERLLVELLGCEAATVVNNNAAATLLALAALARGREVVVSRGELVEIGGSYRVPEILQESGARLREVGTTNRTHASDYAVALTEAAGAILKVHTSNYRVVGFTAEVGLAELVTLGRRRGVPVIHDLGSGCLVDLAARGLPGEDLVADSLAAGADVVCFSGDKLLGGPQAGILVGTKEAIDRCRRHPLFRSLRPGRLIYTALEATLRLYLAGEEVAIEAVPALRQLLTPLPDLEPRAARLAEGLARVPGLAVEVVECESRAGSGSLPARAYASAGVSLRAEAWTPDELARRLRLGEPAVVARIRDAVVLLDVRTVPDDDLPLLVRAVEAATGSVG